jgi:hypothetical protein
MGLAMKPWPVKDRRTKSPLANDRGISLIIVLMVMAILLSIVGAGLLFSGINTKVAMNYRTGTRAFYAADVGITSITTALTSTPTFSATSQIVPQPSGSSGTLCYRFGKRDGTVPTPQPTIKSNPGYSLGSGTGYSTSGYSFYQYQINVTGTYSVGSGCPAVGAETGAREVEAQAQYGPVSN